MFSHCNGAWQSDDFTKCFKQEYAFHPAACEKLLLTILRSATCKHSFL
jgi:hypothetical protein